MNFPFYIAQRYVRSKSSQNVVNIINFVTFLVIVIGSMALFIVLSGFAGLKTFSLSFSQSTDPDLKAQPAIGKFFSISAEQEKELSEISGVVSYAKEIEEQVYLTHKEKSHVAYLKGIDANYIATTLMDSTIYYGHWQIDQNHAVAGRGIVNLLGLAINDPRNPLTILAPKPGKGSLSQQVSSTNPFDNLFNRLPIVLSGVFAIENDLDNKYVFADLPLVQALLEKDEATISGINFKLDETASVSEIRNNIKKVFGDVIVLKDRKELNGTLHRMLNTENLATYLIFTLVLIIALFNVVGAIIMMILDKQQNSKTLYSLGTTVKELRRIYFVQGVLVTSLGGFIGVLLGAILIWSQLAFGWLKITPSLAYPVEFQFVNILVVLATIIVLGVIASKIASSRINKKLVS
ncbi:MAG: ABC transporter permease [Flavobacteriaceae bacterium]|nr:MAG: ABC transporter permease [Flavobacteriaceae bacterium]